MVLDFNCTLSIGKDGSVSYQPILPGDNESASKIHQILPSYYSEEIEFKPKMLPRFLLSLLKHALRRETAMNAIRKAAEEETREATGS